MSVVAKLDVLIESLAAVRSDAEKVEAGKTGTPGTRLRKAAQEAKKSLDEIRKDVLACRNG